MSSLASDLLGEKALTNTGEWVESVLRYMLGLAIVALAGGFALQWAYAGPASAVTFLTPIAGFWAGVVVILGLVAVGILLRYCISSVFNTGNKNDDLPVALQLAIIGLFAWIVVSYLA